jgi:hypothetical protein
MDSAMTRNVRATLYAKGVPRKWQEANALTIVEIAISVDGREFDYDGKRYKIFAGEGNPSGRQTGPILVEAEEI